MCLDCSDLISLFLSCLQMPIIKEGIKNKKKDKN